MKRYKVFDIFWETDGYEKELPKEISISLGDDEDPEEGATSYIERVFGAQINSLDYEEV